MAMPENNDILSLRQVAKEINKVLDSESGQIKTLLKKTKRPKNYPFHEFCLENTPKSPKMCHLKIVLIFGAKIQIHTLY